MMLSAAMRIRFNQITIPPGISHDLPSEDAGAIFMNGGFFE